MIGLGVTVTATLDMLLVTELDKKFTIKLYNYKEHVQRFMEKYNLNDNISFIVCDDYDSTVKGSDVIISSLTVAGQDLCEDDKFDEECLLLPIHTRGFKNCDLFFDKVCGDDIGPIRCFEYFDRFNSFSEVADVMSGQCEGCKNDSERILVYNVGIAIHDIYCS